MKNALHFVRFSDAARYSAAARVFGPPDFVHRFYDQRCIAEIADGDVVIFAEGDDRQPINAYTYDDSARF